MKHKAVLPAVAGALLLAVGLVVASQIFEIVQETEPTPWRGEAALHPYYALKETFAAIGIPTRSSASLRRLPPTDHTLWIVAPERNSSPGRLLEWAAAGGHLVVTPAGNWGEDPLLQALGVQRFGEDQADEDDHLSRPELASERPDWPKLYSHDGVEVLRSEGASDAAWMLTVTVGLGAATVLADGAFLHTEAIGRLDHALIAWNAAVLDHEPAGIWLIYRDPRPSIWTLMTSRAEPLASSLAVFFALGLLFLTRGFGPPLELVPRDRRHLAEHVRATGEFLWGVGCEDALLAAERRALGRRLGRGMQPSNQELAELARRAAAGAGCDEAGVRKALALGETRDPQQFTRTVQVLETLRRSS